MTWLKGFTRVYLVLAVGWFLYAGPYKSWSAAQGKFAELKKSITAVSGLVGPAVIANQQFGLTNSDSKGYYLLFGRGAQTFWSKPENDQIAKLSEMSSKFKAATPQIQKLILMRFRTAAEHLGLVRPLIDTTKRPAMQRWFWAQFWAEFASVSTLVLAVGWPIGVYLGLVGAMLVLRWFWKSLSRWQLLILWATASIALSEIMYPATVILIWADRWTEVPMQKLKTEDRQDYPWMNEIGGRKLIVSLKQWSQDGGEFKEWPDFRRMIAETGMTALIGGGLVLILAKKTG